MYKRLHKEIYRDFGLWRCMTAFGQAPQCRPGSRRRSCPSVIVATTIWVHCNEGSICDS